MRNFLIKFFAPTPRHLGVLFCATSLFLVVSCERKAKTPEWIASPQSPAAPTILSGSAPSEATPEITADDSKRVRFISYNVENWLIMDRYLEKQSLKNSPKPESEKQAVIAILARHSPDVIGLCEIGEATDLAEIQDRLKKAGLAFPHSHFTGGTDTTRHLGLLSRFPITSTSSPAESTYQLAGQTFGINRGILDATVKAHGKNYRFIGVHLKSKRESEQGDQEAIRLNEARLLRRHVDSILSQDASARLIVYGDFNDTRVSNPIKLVTGNYKDPSYLTAIPAKDSRNDTWTYHWALHDIYSRIDLIMVSPGMRDDVEFSAAKVIDDEDWSQASDHRPVLAVFK